MSVEIPYKLCAIQYPVCVGKFNDLSYSELHIKMLTQIQYCVLWLCSYPDSIKAV